MTWITVKFILSVLVLAKASDWFVRGASHVAELLGLPRLFIGIALVGLATNLPEFAVSSAAAWGGHSEIALGNAIGSNTFNTGVILGLCLICTQARFEPVWLRDQGIPMLISCILVYTLSIWSDITRPVGAVLFLLCVAYMAWSTVIAKREPILAQPVEDVVEGAASKGLSLRRRWAVVGLLLIISIPLVLISSRWVLSSSVELARLLGIGESVIALTLVAAGTSLPELTTALAASRRGHYDTAIGINLGSNVYNMFGVLGLSGLISRQPFTAAHRLYDLPVMLLIQIILLAPGLANRSPGRATGYVLLAVYGLYTYSLFTLYGTFS